MTPGSSLPTYTSNSLNFNHQEDQVRKATPPSPSPEIEKHARPLRELVAEKSEGYSDATLLPKRRLLQAPSPSKPPAPAKQPPVQPPVKPPAPAPPPPVNDTSPPTQPPSNPPPPNLPPSNPPPSNPSPLDPPPSNPPPLDPPPSPANPSPSNPSPANPSPSNHTTTNPSPIWTPTQLLPPPPPRTATTRTELTVPIAVGAAAGGVVVVVLITLFLVFCWRKKKRVNEGVPVHYRLPPPLAEHPAPYKDDPYGGQHYNHDKVKFSYDRQPTPPIINSGGPVSNGSAGGDPLPPMNDLTKSTFTYEELLLATSGFADSKLLGQGGFGYVHKGVLPNGKEIAVKQLKKGSGQGEREFRAEVDIISRVHHKHLVSLIGHCISGEKRLLVYEYMPNNTLEFHLHGKGQQTMEWSTRMKIALGAAKGLAYLHEDCHPKIIHRDIKASNILLDYNFEAKVADFGLAKLTSDNNTHVSTRVMGTFGYMAPEYASSGQLTDKSDVFSFGVMLLELITGKRPLDSSLSDMDDNLVDWAKPLILRAQEEGNYEQLVDLRLGNNLNTNEVMRVISCAAACVRGSAKRRPRMSQVVRSLEGDVSREEIGRTIVPIHGSSDNDSSHYREHIEKFQTMGLQSNEYQSSLYSAATTGELGVNQYGSSSEMEMEKMKKNIDGYQFKSQGY